MKHERTFDDNALISIFIKTVNRPIVSIALIGIVVAALLFSDKMLRMDDITAVNLNWWISFIYNLFPWVLMGIVPLLIFGNRSRWFYIPAIILFVVLESVEWFVRFNFKMILDGDWVGMLLGSSSSEVKWFVVQYTNFVTLFVVIGIVLITLGLVAITRLAKNIRVSIVSVGFAFFSLCVFGYANSIITKRFKVFEELIPVHLLADSVRCYKSYSMLAKMKNHPSVPLTMHLDEKIDNVVGVFVLGESAARRRCGMYGYERDTTPCMSRRKDELVLFSDLVTSGGGTTEAMRYLLTTRTIEKDIDLRFTFPQALSYVGYSVSLLSNQERWGEVDGDETFDFAGCSSMTFMGESGETNRYDDVLLPYLSAMLNTNELKQVVFMHLSGSHFPCDGKYPHENAPFTPEYVKNYFYSFNTSIMQNHYDNSIWFTDKVLEKVVSMLETTRRPCWMIYLSDHGDTPSSKNWRTATDRDLWDIPFIVWTSKEFKEKYPEKVLKLTAAKDKPLQSDQLLYGLLDFAGVEGLGIEPCENFLDEEFRPRRPRLIQGGKSIYSWD